MAKREKEIRMMVSTEEYENISARAKEVNMQVAPYIRTVAQNPTILYWDYSPIEQHTRAIGEIRNSINRLIFTIEATNNYLPREIETIVNLMTDIFESENNLLKTMRETRAKHR